MRNQRTEDQTGLCVCEKIVAETNCSSPGSAGSLMYDLYSDMMRLFYKKYSHSVSSLTFTL